MSIVERLTEGIVNRDLSTEGAALISKWEQTGLLEGISDDTQRNGMARLLENQAKELLRESSSMAAGDVEGFAAVAFPLVRRVFGSLIANDLVSVQPMSLPSGLIFFLDFLVSPNIGTGTTADRLGYPTDTSLYGGGRVASQITGGVLLSGVNAERGPYALNNGYSSPTGSLLITPTVRASGSVGADGVFVADTGSDTDYDGANMLEFDDSHIETGHPGASIIQPALVLAEKHGKSREELVEAIVAGYEFNIRWARAAFNFPDKFSGPWSSSLLQAYGTTVMASKLLDLDESQIRRAFFFMAANMPLPVNQKVGILPGQTLSSLKNNYGFAAQGAVLAVLTALTDAQAEETVLDGD